MRPSVTLYTDECTGDQQPIHNIAAAKFNNGGDAGHDLQFGFVCSQANTIGKDQDAAPISTTIMSRMRQNPRWRIEGLVDKIC